MTSPWILHHEDCLKAMAAMESDSVDAIVTDPPYGLEFMGKDWDSFGGKNDWQAGGGFAKPGIGERAIAWPSFSANSKFGAANPTCGTCGGRARGKKSCSCATPNWKPIGKRRNPENEGLPDDMTGSGASQHSRAFQEFSLKWATECLRVAKPGAYLLAFGGTRMYHRLAVAIEDAGWEIRDSIGLLGWVYGCLSEDTEILVNGAWVHYRSAIEGSLALCYDAGNETFSQQPIEQLFVYDYDDTAYRIESERTDQVVSRNHRCIVWRSGRWEFVPAEEVAREQEARVPVLEAVSDVLDALSLLQPNASGSQQVVRGVLDEGSPGSTQPEFDLAGAPCGSEAAHNGRNNVLGLRQEGAEAALVVEESGDPLVLPAVQREATRRGVGEARTQGPIGVDGKERVVLPREDARRSEPGVEGRGDDLQDARELRGGEVPSLSTGVPPDGAEGRLCDGAPPDCSESARSLSASDGDGASRGPRSDEQHLGEPVAVQVESGPQTVRASRFTTSDLARITPFHLTGKVWCVKVPTGAFVARRNGKVFVTGNSGFPKSLDVSKVIDKAAGAEREVVGTYTARGFSGTSPTEDGRNQWAAGEVTDKVGTRTAPATDAAKQWAGFGTALKPAWEPIIVARKPLISTVAANVLKHGTGGLNIDGCRIETSENLNGGAYKSKAEVEDNEEDSYQCIDPNCPDAATMPYHDHPAEKRKGRHDGTENWRYKHGGAGGFEQPKGRWPSNVILGCCGNDPHDPDCAVRLLDEQTGVLTTNAGTVRPHNATMGYGGSEGSDAVREIKADSGGPSRFFYTAKASRSERTHGGEVVNLHPTVKPTSLMRYLVRLVTPPGGVVLDPFCGSGSTGVAAILEGFNFVGSEMEAESVKTSKARLELAVLVSVGGVKNPWEDEPAETAPAEEAPVISSIEDLFGFDE